MKPCFHTAAKGCFIIQEALSGSVFFVLPALCLSKQLNANVNSRNYSFYLHAASWYAYTLSVSICNSLGSLEVSTVAFEVFLLV